MSGRFIASNTTPISSLILACLFIFSSPNILTVPPSLEINPSTVLNVVDLPARYYR